MIFIYIVDQPREDWAGHDHAAWSPVLHWPETGHGGHFQVSGVYDFIWPIKLNS